ESRAASRRTTAQCTANDPTGPQFTAVPPNATYQCLSQVPAASPSQATATDNCGAPTITVADNSNGGAGTTASPLIISRRFTATDANGNKGYRTQTITVIDNMAPTINCPTPISVDRSNGFGRGAAHLLRDASGQS